MKDNSCIDDRHAVTKTAGRAQDQKGVQQLMAEGGGYHDNIGHLHCPVRKWLERCTLYLSCVLILPARQAVAGAAGQINILLLQFL